MQCVKSGKKPIPVAETLGHGDTFVKKETSWRQFLFIIIKTIWKIVYNYRTVFISKKFFRKDEETDVITNMYERFYSTEWSPTGYKRVWMFLEGTLYSMYGFTYPFHFRNSTRSEMMKRFVTSKIISKINDNASCLQCFK